MNYEAFFTANDFLLMLRGAGITFVLTFASGAVGTVMGFFIGWGRAVNNRPLYLLLGAYIDVIRSVPLIIQFVLFNSFMAIAGFPLNPFLSGIITLSVYISGYVSEVVTAGIQSVPVQTRRSARSLGMSYLQDFWHVTAPLGIRSALPAWTGLILGLMKDTSIISVIGATPPELVASSTIIINRIQEPLLVLSGAGMFYFAMCWFVDKLSRRYEHSWILARGTL